MTIAKYIKLYFKLVSAGIRAQLQYRFAFVMRIIGMITAYTGTAVTMWVMLYQFQTLGDWNFFEMLFYSRCPFSHGDFASSFFSFSQS